MVPSISSDLDSLLLGELVGFGLELFGGKRDLNHVDPQCSGFNRADATLKLFSNVRLRYSAVLNTELWMGQESRGQ